MGEAHNLSWRHYQGIRRGTAALRDYTDILKSIGIDYTCPPVYSFTTMNTLLLLVALAAPFVLLGAAVAALIVIIGRRASR